jgi:hypothetical protein
MGGMLTRSDNGDEATSRKPNLSNFHQQKLRAWQPILTASTILPVFFAIGIVFIPIGIALLATSSKIEEKVIEYSSNKDCMKCEDRGLLDTFKQGQPLEPLCKCSIPFNITSLWEGDVFFYYGLSNFYQNHRRYVRSYDMKQLNGELSDSVTADCDPFRVNKTTGKPIAPCGAVANSLFTDTFALTRGDNKDVVPMSAKDIAWKSDREVKFKNPPGNLTTAFSGFAKPQYWTKPVYELDPSNPSNNGFKNEDFIVWMRVAAFPTFRKLYRRLVRGSSGDYKDGLPKGEYNLEVTYNYPVKSFSGEKRFIMTTTSWMGGKNPFLGIAYIVVGCLCLMFGFVFLVIHLKVRNSQAVINDGGH